MYYFYSHMLCGWQFADGEKHDHFYQWALNTEPTQKDNVADERERTQFPKLQTEARTTQTFDIQTATSFYFAPVSHKCLMHIIPL